MSFVTKSFSITLSTLKNMPKNNYLGFTSLSGNIVPKAAITRFRSVGMHFIPNVISRRCNANKYQMLMVSRPTPPLLN